MKSVCVMLYIQSVCGCYCCADPIRTDFEFVELCDVRNILIVNCITNSCIWNTCTGWSRGNACFSNG